MAKKNYAGIKASIKLTSLSNVNTTGYERELLHVMADKLSRMNYIGKAKPDYFTNPSRRVIFDMMTRSRMTMNDDFIEMGLSKIPGLDDDAKEDIRQEYSLIMGKPIVDDIEDIFRELEDTQTGFTTESLLVESYDLLKQGRFQEAAAMLKAKSLDIRTIEEEKPLVSIKDDLDGIVESIRNRRDNPDQFTGLPTGFTKFDKINGGLFPAELTVFFGLSGRGKSSVMKALAVNVAKSGHVVLHCGNEENRDQMLNKYLAIISGVEYRRIKRGQVTDEELDEIDRAREIAGNIEVLEMKSYDNANVIRSKMNELDAKGIRVGLIVMDYLDLMQPILPKYDNENEAQGWITTDLKQIAIDYGCPVVTATQASVDSEKKEKMDNPNLKMEDMFGSKRKIHSANTVIGILNQTAGDPEKADKDHSIVMHIVKNRDEANYKFWLKLNPKTGRITDDSDKMTV